MTKRDKIVLFSAVLLAACVIATSLLFMSSGNGSGRVHTGSLVYVAILGATACLSVVLVYLFRIRRNRFEQQLRDEFYLKYEIVKDAVANSQLTAKEKKEIREDLLDLLLSAQKAGRSAEDVMRDPVAFSSDVIHSYANPGRLAVLSLLEGIVVFSLFSLGIHTVLWLEQMEKALFAVRTDVNLIVLVILLSFVILPLTRKLAGTRNTWAFLLPLGFGIAFVLIAELSRALFYSLDIVQTFLDGSVRMVPNPAAFLALLLSIPVFAQIRTYVRKHVFNT